MDSSKPILYGLIKYRGESYEGSIGAQKPLDQRNINLMAKIASPPLYWGETLVLEDPIHCDEILLLSSHQGGGKPPPYQHKVQGRIRGKGPLPPRTAATLLLPALPSYCRRGTAASRVRRHGDLQRHLLHGLHIIIIFINIYKNSSSSSSVISGKTWCMMQYIIFPWSIVFLCWCLSS
jgi:hypothetical protein